MNEFGKRTYLTLGVNSKEEKKKKTNSNKNEAINKSANVRIHGIRSYIHARELHNLQRCQYSFGH